MFITLVIVSLSLNPTNNVYFFQQNRTVKAIKERHNTSNSLWTICDDSSSDR